MVNSSTKLDQPKVDRLVKQNPNLGWRYNGYPAWYYFGPTTSDDRKY